MTQQGGIDKASGFEALRARLLALAYRMLGSRAEAEDVVQDVWLKWHLADTEGIETPAAWLTTLVTRTAIDRFRHVQRERAKQASGWLPEPWLDDMAPSAEELALRSSEMSYGVMLLLERLKPDERAAFVLHEAFDCDYAEIGGILERTPAACRQIVRRAKTRLQRAGAPLERPDPVAHARIVERLRTALEEQDRTGMLRLFSDAPEVVSDAPATTAVNALATASAAAMPMSMPMPMPMSKPRPAARDTVKAGVAARAGASGRVRQAAAVQWVDTVVRLAEQASSAEVVSVEGAMGIALFLEGEVVGVLDVSTAQATDRSTRIVGLRIVTSAARLRSANRALGRTAVARLLARTVQRECLSSVPVITRTARTTRMPAELGTFAVAAEASGVSRAESVAMSSDFPIDVYA